MAYSDCAQQLVPACTSARCLSRFLGYAQTILVVHNLGSEVGIHADSEHGRVSEEESAQAVQVLGCMRVRCVRA
jgi:hypothetical protein